MSFKENWERKDERCPQCNQITKIQRGITKEHLVKFIKPKWDSKETIILLLFVVIVIMSLFYKVETQTSREWVQQMSSSDLENCKSNCNVVCDKIYPSDTNQAISYNNLTSLNTGG